MIEYPVALLEWCEALESGNFLRGQGKLRRPGGYYCCLGVFAMLNGGMDEKGHPLNPDLWVPCTYGIPTPSEAVVNESSLGAVFPHSTNTELRHIRRKLMAMNDGGSSFRAIAEEIKREYRESVPAAG